ncbi:MAG TPA: PEP-utilizing enzyme [Nannocystaceae bacterium]|nr:PEP-utilizing enzyme [Nannocystaceae bacterium]
MLRWLHSGPAGALAPKAAALARATIAGLPVPPGFAVALDDPRSQWRDAFTQLRAGGDVIVRSALAHEDGAHQSGAGLGISIAGVLDEDACAAAIAAIAAARDHARDGDQAIVQRRIDGRALLVLACEAELDYLEVHLPGGDPLASGASPRFSGPLSSWHDPARDALARCVADVRAGFGDARFGLDLEAVVTHDDAIALVQVRPLTAPLHPGWPDFAAAIAAMDPPPSLAGTLVLDAEHNPAPLSAAHADLVRWLGTQRADAGGPVALAGWLYVRTLPRELTGRTSTPIDPRAVLRRLHEHVIPDARARLDEIVRACDEADAHALPALFDRARAAFLAMIDAYLGELVPARRGWAELVPDRDDPLCLRARDEVLDVLPFAWDVASATMASDRAPAKRSATLPDDAAIAATLLREHDDHLFALGLAPVRAVYLRAAQLLGVADDVFLLAGDELLAALARRHADDDLLARRRREATRAQGLLPPPRIVDGHPAGAAPRWLRGFAIGSDFTGPLAQRRDLADLEARPPSRDRIAVLPALTAPAAVVIARLGLRAVVCEHGGAMSHAALIARELGLSALLGCKGCTTIADEARMKIDVRTGALRRAE